MPRAARVADKLKAALALDQVTLTPGDRGEFTVWVGETVVAKKDYSGFPDEDTVIERVRAGISAAQGPG